MMPPTQQKACPSNMRVPNPTEIAIAKMKKRIKELEKKNASLHRIVDGIQRFMRMRPEGAEHY